MDTETLNQEENMVTKDEYTHIQNQAVNLLKENLLLKAKLKYIDLVSDSNQEIINSFNRKMMLAVAKNEEFDDPRTKYEDEIQQAFDEMIDIECIVNNKI